MRGGVRALVGRKRQLVHLRAINAVLVGDHLGRFALRYERIAVEQLLRKSAPPLLLRLLVHRKADAPHVLDSGRDDRFVDPGGDAQRGEVQRLLTRAAPDVERRRAGRLRESLLEPGAARDTGRLLRHLVDATGDDVVDLRGVDAAAFDQACVDTTQEIGGMQVAENALLTMSAPNGGADRLDDEGVSAKLRHTGLS